MKTAYLTGYTGKPTRKPEQLLRLATNLDAVVVDSRFSPWSRWASHWNRYQLQALLLKRYLWIGGFGNKAYREGRIELVDPTSGIYQLNNHTADNFIILCACADGESCHRKQVGEYLAARGWTVREVTQQEWEAAR